MCLKVHQLCYGCGGTEKDVVVRECENHESDVGQCFISTSYHFRWEPNIWSHDDQWKIDRQINIYTGNLCSNCQDYRPNTPRPGNANFRHPTAQFPGYGPDFPRGSDPSGRPDGDNQRGSGNGRGGNGGSGRGGGGQGRDGQSSGGPASSSRSSGSRSNGNQGNGYQGNGYQGNGSQGNGYQARGQGPSSTAASGQNSGQRPAPNGSNNQQRKDSIPLQQKAAPDRPQQKLASNSPNPPAKSHQPPSKGTNGPPPQTKASTQGNTSNKKQQPAKSSDSQKNTKSKQVHWR